MVRRSAALLGVFAVLFAYDEVAQHLWRQGVWWDVAWIAIVLMPATFGLVLIALPLSRSRWEELLPVGFAFAVLAAVLTIAHWNVPANFARLAAASLLAWAFLRMFESLAQVVLVSLVIPWIDALSVWRGPTKTLTSQHPHVFSVLSYAFPVPGKHAAANLGVPDLFFFALFLATAKRFGLRVVPTWIGLVAGLGVTIALTVWWNLNGLPALPGISVGFLLPNADLIWQRLRRQPRLGDGPQVPLGGTPDDV